MPLLYFKCLHSASGQILFCSTTVLRNRGGEHLLWVSLKRCYINKYLHSQLPISHAVWPFTCWHTVTKSLSLCRFSFHTQTFIFCHFSPYTRCEDLIKDFTNFIEQNLWNQHENILQYQHCITAWECFWLGCTSRGALKLIRCDTIHIRLTKFSRKHRLLNRQTDVCNQSINQSIIV